MAEVTYTKHTALDRLGLSSNDSDFDGRTTLEFHGNCASPARIRRNHVDFEYSVRCRNCAPCQRARQYLWKLRGQAETLQVDRSWLFTGTFSNPVWDVDIVKKECTDYYKRVRRGMQRNEKRWGMSPRPFRYMMAYEHHKSGSWHIHAMLHTPATHDEVTIPWSAGFNSAKRVGSTDLRAAGYVTKYVTKSLGSGEDARRPRIRASEGYGAQVIERDEDKVKELQSRIIRYEATFQTDWKMIRSAMEREQKEPLWKMMLSDPNMRSLSSGEKHETWTFDPETGEVQHKTR